MMSRREIGDIDQSAGRFPGRSSTRGLSDHERHLIDDAVAAGRITVCPPQQVDQSACGSAEGMPLQPSENLRRGPEPRELRRMGVRSALEWAFGVEHARLNFDGEIGFGSCGFGTEYLLMERGLLGQTIDTSPGRSRPAEAAQVIADVVQHALPRSSAIRIEMHARAGTMPWSRSLSPKLEPCDWTCGRGGKWRGRTEDARKLGPEGWRPQLRVNRRGRKIVEPVKYTPCRWTVTAQQIGRQRREYLEWWQDLLILRTELMGMQFQWIAITRQMPLMRPWDEPT